MTLYILFCWNIIAALKTHFFWSTKKMIYFRRLVFGIIWRLLCTWEKEQWTYIGKKKGIHTVTLIFLKRAALTQSSHRATFGASTEHQAACDGVRRRMFYSVFLGDKGCETLPSEGVSVHVSAAVKVGRKWKVLRRCLCAPRNNIFISKMLGLFE